MTSQVIFRESAFSSPRKAAKKESCSSIELKIPFFNQRKVKSEAEEIRPIAIYPSVLLSKYNTHQVLQKKEYVLHK